MNDRGTVPWSEVKARHDAKLRMEFGPWGYRLYRIRRFAYGRRLAFVWRFQGGIGSVVGLLQKLCQHDNCAIVRYVKDDTRRDDQFGYLSICGFCGFYEVEDHDEIYDEALRRIREMDERDDG